MRYRVRFYLDFSVDAESSVEAIKKARNIFKRNVNIGHYMSQLFKADTSLIKSNEYENRE